VCCCVVLPKGLQATKLKAKSWNPKGLLPPCHNNCAGICGNPNHDHTFTIGRPRATSDFSSDISSDFLLKTKLQTFSSEVTRGNKTSEETSDIWLMIPWRTSEYSSDFLFLSLFRQKNLREFFRHFFRHFFRRILYFRARGLPVVNVWSWLGFPHVPGSAFAQSFAAYHL
jgi:hypothetical protein